MNILAMDLGKSKTVFCDYSSDNGEHEFGKVNTSPQEIHDLIVEKDPQRVVLEICSTAGWIFDMAKALNKETEVANTSHEAWRWKNVKKKNDKQDALNNQTIRGLHKPESRCDRYCQSQKFRHK